MSKPASSSFIERREERGVVEGEGADGGGEDEEEEEEEGMVVERVAVAMVDVVTDGGMAWLCEAACS